MKSPTVSVIMATYNHANFVAEAIQSVLGQVDVDFEFLISDDGSADSTRDVVAAIQDERIKFFPNEVNRGACVVTNELIERASGEFIALINSDDYWSVSDKLAMQVQFMRENPEVGACFGRARFVDKNGVAMEKSSIPAGDVFDQPNRSQGEWLRRLFELGNCICHPTVLIRKSCYEHLGMYSNRLRQLPDMDMWVRLVKHYPIHIFDKELITFRIMPGENASSQTATNSIRTINEHYLIAENFFDDVTAKQLMDGFTDLLKLKSIDSDIHLEIEKALLFLGYNQWLGKPYQMVGMLKLNALLNSPAHHDVMVNQYGLDDRWFQKELGEIDVLRPKVVAVMSQQKSRAIRVWQRYFGKLSR
ncbi:glycosyltransferase [Pseudomonas sp. TH03]|uniref:glycosyltransferase n=1 Tax=Pseudomonas sp. TH03 TaxID=2796369 RepID=UPI001914347C|nr:glycosyltransferase [Pseudomonas sp. TH03]MBK5552229.1 glycosyltransferase [Pseudomonas sp. TH03]